MSSVEERLNEHERQIKLLIQEVSRLGSYIVYKYDTERFQQAFSNCNLYSCKKCKCTMPLQETFLHNYCNK